MGAAGGISYVKVKNPECYERAHCLVNILDILVSDFRDETWEYMERENVSSPHYICTAYGTDVDHEGFDELRNVLEDKSLFKDQRTFEEVIQDLATKPHWELFELTEFENILLRTYCRTIYLGLHNGNANYWISKGPFAITEMILNGFNYIRGKHECGLNLSQLKVCDWAHELDHMVDWKHVGTEETWT